MLWHKGFRLNALAKLLNAFLQGEKSNNRTTENVSVNYACICKQTLLKAFTLKLFTKALQIATKARNHERNYQLSFKQEVNASMNIFA